MKIYTTKKEVLQALADYPACSKERYAILSSDNNRNLVLSTGASVILYSSTQSSDDLIENIEVGIIERLNSKTKQREGIGNLGGLSERITPEDFNKFTPTEKLNALGDYDNVTIINNKIVTTNDITTISINNIKREASEELENINATTKGIRFNQASCVPLPNLKDDNYILNIWNGQGDVFAINPMVYTLEVDKQILNDIVAISKENNRQENTEVLDFKTIKLKDALTRFGKMSKSNNARNQTTDYRYPHEWLGTWNLASKILKDEDKLINLAIKLQKKTPYLINFELAQIQTGQTDEDLSQTLDISTLGVKKLKKSIKQQFNLNNKVLCSLQQR